jgi:hypothetical protein
MASMTRTMNFYWNDIKTVRSTRSCHYRRRLSSHGHPQPGSLVLTFVPPVPSKPQTATNAHAWRVIQYKNNGSATVTFQLGAYGFGTLNHGVGNVASTSNWLSLMVRTPPAVFILPQGEPTTIQPGEGATLQPDGSFSSPAKDPQLGQLMEVKNESGKKRTMSFGSHEFGAPEAALTLLLQARTR